MTGWPILALPRQINPRYDLPNQRGPPLLRLRYSGQALRGSSPMFECWQSHRDRSLKASPDQPMIRAATQAWEGTWILRIRIFRGVSAVLYSHSSKLPRSQYCVYRVNPLAKIRYVSFCFSMSHAWRHTRTDRAGFHHSFVTRRSVDLPVVPRVLGRRMFITLGGAGALTAPIGSFPTPPFKVKTGLGKKSGVRRLGKVLCLRQSDDFHRAYNQEYSATTIVGQV